MAKNALASRKTLCILALCLVGTASGCTASARLHVLRPAMLNARQFGPTMSVEGFVGAPQAAALIAGELQHRVASAEGAPVTLVPTGGALIVHGTILDYSYRERVSRQMETCTRSATDSQGNSYQQSYSCTRHTRFGEANVAVLFLVTVASTGQQVVGMTLEDASTARRTAVDRTPGYINGDAMVERLRAGITERFARVILPWREEVRVAFGRCGEARGACDGGILAVREGDFATAIQFFEQAVAELQAQEQPRPRHLADAYWNLGLAHEYSGSFQQAVDCILHAARFAPNNSAYAAELRNVQQMAADAQRLQEQGVHVEQPPAPSPAEAPAPSPAEAPAPSPAEAVPPS